MSRPICVRLDDELYDHLNAIVAVTGQSLSNVVRDMLREQTNTSLASADFHVKLAARQEALARLTAYAPEPEVEEEDSEAVAPMVPENGAGPDLSALVE